MTMDKLPRWTWWAAGTVLLWIVWALMVGRPMMQKVADLKGREHKTETERAALDARMAAVPALVLRLNEAQRQLDSTLSGFVTDDAIDDMISQLRSAGGHRGLGDVCADPELMSLLHTPMAESTPGTANGRLDTVIVNLSASGAFKSLGRWLDDVEARPDFRFWTMGRWASNSDDGRVRLEAQAALVVVNQQDTLATLARMGQPE